MLTKTAPKLAVHEKGTSSVDCKWTNHATLAKICVYKASMQQQKDILIRPQEYFRVSGLPVCCVWHDMTWLLYPSRLKEKHVLEGCVYCLNMSDHITMSWMMKVFSKRKLQSQTALTLDISTAAFFNSSCLCQSKSFRLPILLKAEVAFLCIYSPTKIKWKGIFHIDFFSLERRCGEDASWGSLSWWATLKIPPLVPFYKQHIHS